MPPAIGVGMLGYAFMGKAHSRALRALRELDPPLLPELVSISGRDTTALEADRSIWRFDRAQAATGAIGDLETHIIDRTRFLAGEIDTVSASVRTYVAGHEVDDAFMASIELAGGAIGTLEASRLALGRINQ